MAFAHRVAAIPVSKVELFICCNGLLNKDVTSKSDPMCVIYLQDKGRWYEVSSARIAYLVVHTLGII